MTQEEVKLKHRERQLARHNKLRQTEAGRLYLKEKSNRAYRNRSSTEEGRSKEARRQLAAYYRDHEKGKEKGRKNSKLYYYRHKDKCKVYRRKEQLKKYGMVESDYLEILKKQDGVCKLCFSLPKKRKLNVDHCHKTGKIRGLLCTHCNKNLLGSIEKHPGLFERIGKYIVEDNYPNFIHSSFK